MFTQLHHLAKRFKRESLFLFRASLQRRSESILNRSQPVHGSMYRNEDARSMLALARDTERIVNSTGEWGLVRELRVGGDRVEVDPEGVLGPGSVGRGT